MGSSDDKLFKEAAAILTAVKFHARDDTNFDWVYYETAQDMRNEIDQYIASFEKGSREYLDEVNMHFLPTAAYQEHSIANDWVAEYYVLAERFDKIYAALKSKTSF
ncbi:hypothetical protein [Ferruginibacter sp.]